MSVQVIIFLIIFFSIRAIIRARRAPQKPANRPAAPQVPKEVPQKASPVWSSEGTSANPYYNMEETVPMKAVDPSHHHHKENVIVQAEGYAGEGDPNRYRERELCSTDQYDAVPSDSAFDPSLDDEALRNAIIWSEILGKPKALQHHNGGMIS